MAKSVPVSRKPLTSLGNSFISNRDLIVVFGRSDLASRGLTYLLISFLLLSFLSSCYSAIEPKRALPQSLPRPGRKEAFAKH
jgi:hypothetical protein